jgi:hypothetical protein
VELPPALVAGAGWMARIDGTRDERAAIVQRVHEDRPHRLLLVCHGRSTPDRGTGRFFADARAHATGLLLVPATAAAADVKRWRAWLDASGFGEMPVFAAPDDAHEWMGS